MHTTLTGPSEKRFLLLVAVVALALRIALIFLVTPMSQRDRWDDDGDYTRFSQSLVTTGRYEAPGDGGGVPMFRNWRAPLFVWMIAGIYKVHGLNNDFWVRFYTAVLSMLVPFGCWYFTKKIWGPIPALMAFTWCCFHPAFIHYAVRIQNDSIYLDVGVWALALIICQTTALQSFLAGFLSAVTCLSRSQFVGAFMFGLAWIFFNPKKKMKPWWSLLYVGAFVLCMTPWWVRNYQVFHTFVPFTSEGGFTLWVGNNPKSDGGGNTMPSIAPKELNEIERDKWNYREGIREIRENPERTFKLGLSKLSRFWAIVPRVGSPATKMVAFLSHTPLFILCLIGLWVWRQRLVEILPFLLFALYSTALHSIFPSVMRYRLLLEPFMIALASATLWHLIQQYRTKQAVHA